VVLSDEQGAEVVRSDLLVRHAGPICSLKRF
jgi:hypothetical protein